MPVKPLFYLHLLKRDEPGEELLAAGLLDEASFEVRAAGFYAEAVLDLATRAAGRIVERVERGRAAYSSGAIPQVVKVRADGFVEEWPLMEASVADVEQVVSQPGTTAVMAIRGFSSALRAFNPGVEVIESEQVQRSIWIMPDSQGSGSTNGAVVPPVVPPVVEGFSEEQVQRLVTAAVQALPTRSLLPGATVPEANPRVQVASKYDGVSLLALLCLDQASRLERAKQGKSYVRSEEFLRALVDKTRVIREREAKVSVLGSAIRAVDEESFLAWHKYVPHLRADEALQSTLAGAGDELVPTLFNSAAWYQFRIESRVLGLLDAFQMPSNPYNWPVISGGPDIRRVLESTDQSQASIPTSPIPASKPTTALIPFQAGEIGALALVSKVLFEDAGLNVAEALATQFSRNMADKIDYVLINGDKAATTGNVSHNGVDPTGTVYDAILALNGFRKNAYANNKWDLATLTIDDLTELQKLMPHVGIRKGIVGTDLANLVALVDASTYYKMKTLAEFRTMEKSGPELNTLLNGFVQHWDRIPVVLSGQMELVNASGYIPSAHNGTLGQIVLVHRTLNKVGYMRQIEVEQGPVPHTGLFAMSATVRLDMQPMETGAAAYGYNATV